ncbi:MAG TPA: hypothetical protein VKB09_03070 [Thermomicrobiales bacterium]|nr:hypothetical protein [Thermomicrobiales bacterium]
MAPSSDDLYDRFIKADVTQLGHLIGLLRSTCATTSNLAVEPWCRGVQLDNVNLVQEGTGAPIGAPDQLAYNAEIAWEAPVALDGVAERDGVTRTDD